MKLDIINLSGNRSNISLYAYAAIDKKSGVGVDWMPAPLLYRINIQKAMACPAGTTGFVSGYKSSTK